jgi:DNA-binding SARP family transcriptional activator/tetratricopeptide (TPR) repeat protein
MAGSTMFHIQSLGGVTIRDDGRNTVRLRSRKHVALLLYLAASGKRVLTRDYLAALLWTSPPERARHSLSQAIYDLRRNLDGAVVSGAGDGLRLDQARITFDASEFETAVRNGDLARAVQLHQGPFADNLSGAGSDDFERWVDGERLRLSRLGEFVLRRYVRECDGAGRWGEMCVAALKLVRISPIDEEAHRALMRGLWLHGDATSAIRHFEETAPLLERELPGGVSEETKALAQRIRSAPVPAKEPTRFVEQETPFLGRENEFNLLRSVVETIDACPTTAVIVYGEAGIGKTRLFREFTTPLALQNIRLLESRCYPAETDVPYGPVVEGIRPIAAEVARTLPAEAECFTRLGHLLPEFEHICRPHDEGIDPAAWRRRLYEEVASLVRQSSAAKPIVWVIEDVQWIDATSASLLHYITRRLEGSPFLLIASLRTARGEDLPSTLPVSPPGPTELTKALHLSPLTEEQIRQIVVHTRPDAADHPGVALAQHLSAGNPLLALEVFRAAVDSMEWAEEAHSWDPLTDSRLGRVLAVRVEGLTRPALRLLQAVAVLERHTGPRGVSTVAGLSLSQAAEHSAELYTRGLLVDSEGKPEFANDIIREYVYADMRTLERAALHLAAAQFLAGSPEASSATLARHYHLGDDRSRTYKYAIAAAREAGESAAHREAAAMARLALETARSSAERLAALHLLAESELESAQLTNAREHFEQILRLDTRMSAERRIEVKLRIVRTLAELSQWSSGRQVLSDVTSDIQEVTDPSSRLLGGAETLFWSLKIAIRQNDSELAKQVAESAAELEAKALTDGSLTADARASAMLSVAAYTAFFESSEKALSLLTDVRSDLAALSLPLAERVHLLKGMVHLRMAQWDNGEYEIKQALEIASKRNDLVQLSSLWNNLACCALEQGDWAASESFLSRAEAIQIALPDPLDAALPLTLNRANALFYQGQTRDAGQLYDKAFDIANTVDSKEFIPELLACKGLVSLQLGNAGDARRSWIALEETRKVQLVGSQERFKLEWFRAYILRQVDRDEALSRLLFSAREQIALDVPSYLKLMWLGVLLFGDRLMTEHGMTPDRLREHLRLSGLRWFVLFSNRWLRTTAGRRI